MLCYNIYSMRYERVPINIIVSSSHSMLRTCHDLFQNAVDKSYQSLVSLFIQLIFHRLNVVGKWMEICENCKDFTVGDRTAIDNNK